jgi:hypothetical protein
VVGHKFLILEGLACPVGRSLFDTPDTCRETVNGCLYADDGCVDRCRQRSHLYSERRKGMLLLLLL